MDGVVSNPAITEDITWNGYRLCRFNESHVDALITISKSAFGIIPTREYYTGKNKTDRWGGSYLGYIAFSESGEPAAFYGVYACDVELDGVVYHAVQSGDTMTHKSHMGKGLFIKLAQLTYELCNQLGFAFVFGFPNDNSYPGFVKKLNWICPDNLREFRIRTVTFPLIKIARKFPFTRKLVLSWVGFVNLFYRANGDYFPSSVIQPGVGGVKRSKEFLDYKIKNQNSFVISLAGRRIWLKPDGFLFIGDIELTGEELVMKKFISRLKLYSFLVGADVIVFQTAPGTRLDEKFSSEMEAVKAFRFGYCAFNVAVDPGKFRYIMADLDTF